MKHGLKGSTVFAAMGVLAVSSAQATIFNWSNNTSGNWSSTSLTTDWKSATVPNTAGAGARYTHSGTASASGTVTLDMPATVGMIDHQGGVPGSTGMFAVQRHVDGFALTMDNTGGVNNYFGNANAAIVGNGNANTFNITQVYPDLVISNTDLDIGSIGGGVLIGSSANSCAITAATDQNLNLRWNAGNAARPMTVNASIGTSGAGVITLRHYGTGVATHPMNLNGTIGAKVGSILQDTTVSVLRLNADNAAFTGPVYLKAGTILANHANALGTGGLITFSGGALSYTAASKGQDWAARMKNSTTGAIVIETGGQNVSLSAIDASNTAGLWKTGTGTLTLTGTNTFSGDARSVLGTLALGHAAALAVATLDMNSGDAGTVTLAVSGVNTYAFGGLKGTRALALNGNTVNVGSNNVDTVYGGVLDNGALVKAGAGVLELSGANTYAGGTTVASGTLRLSGGNDRLAAAGALALGAATTLDVTNTTQTVASLALGDGVTLQTAVAAAGACGALTVNSAVAGAAGLKVLIVNQAALDGTQTYTVLTSSVSIDAVPQLEGVAFPWVLSKVGNTIRLGVVNGSVFTIY